MMGASLPVHGEGDEAVDVVCGEMFPPELAVFESDHEGKRYLFCSKTCKRTFDSAPQGYAQTGTTGTEGA